MTSTKLVRFLVAALILIIAGNISFAQNTKGDKPSKPLPRITLKSKPGRNKTVKSNTRDISGRRLRTKNKSSAARAVVTARSPYEGRRSRGGDRASKPIGGRPRIQSSSAQAARNNVYPNKGPYVNNPSKRPRKSERSFNNPAPIGQPVLYSVKSNASPYPKKRRINPRSGSSSFITRGRKNVYWGKFSKGEKAFTRDITGRPLRTKNYRTPSPGLINQTNPYSGNRNAGDKSYKGTFRSGFNSASNRGKRATSLGISGKPIRRSKPRNTQIIGRLFYPRKLSISSKNNGKAGVKFLPRKLSISGKGKNRSLGNGYQSISGQAKNNRPIPVRIPSGGGGIAGYKGNFRRNQLSPSFQRQGIGFRGSMKARTISGGAVASYRGNIKQTQLSPGFTRQGIGYTGNIKGGRLSKGGGSISGRLKNNKGNPVFVRTPPAQSARAGTFSGNLKSSGLRYRDQGEEFKGFVRTRKPLKGGGSISGLLKNNKGNPISARIPPARSARAGTYSGNLKANSIFNYNDQGEEFKGYMKAQKPIKGGGSISGRSRNNNGSAIAVKLPPGSSARTGTYTGNLKKPRGFDAYRDQGEEFRGFIKGRKPLKGGGSVSGKLWNNNEEPIPVKAEKDYSGSGFGGKIKLKRFNSYTQNPNANENATKKKSPSNNTFLVNGLQIKVKQDDYKQNPLASKYSLKKKEIGSKSSTVKASEYEGKMKMLWSYSHNPSSSKDALKTISPNRAFNRGNEFQGRSRLTRNYRHNPKSDKEALKVIAPGRAYAKINNYQGNLKMSKPHGSKLHPDAKFAHGHIDNVKKERTILTNVKLLWSKLFKKNDVQPAAVKEKVRRPRYDKKEKDLWKDLYD